MLMQNAFRFIEGGADRRGDQRVAGHELADGLAKIGGFGEARVAIAEDADQAPLLVDDGHAADVELAHQVFGVLQGGGGRQRHRIDDHARLGAFHFFHLGGLLRGRHVAMDDADAALACQRNRQPRFGDCIHRRRDERNIEPEIARQPRFDLGLIGQHVGVTGDNQEIVKSEGFEFVEEFFVHGTSMRKDVKRKS